MWKTLKWKIADRETKTQSFEEERVRLGEGLVKIWHKHGGKRWWGALVLPSGVQEQTDASLLKTSWYSARPGCESQEICRSKRCHLATLQLTHAAISLYFNDGYWQKTCTAGGRRDDIRPQQFFMLSNALHLCVVVSATLKLIRSISKKGILCPAPWHWQEGDCAINKPEHMAEVLPHILNFEMWGLNAEKEDKSLNSKEHKT